MPLSCRFYSECYPEIDDVVMVKIRSMESMGAYVNLLEYNNIEGMILLSELSRRRIRSINRLIRVGNTEPVVVIRVDKEKGYFDLSKRRVSPEDVEICTERFNKAKVVNSILRHVAELLNYESNAQFEELYRKTAWFYEEKTKQKSSAYDFFKQAIQNPSLLAECGLDVNTQNVLLDNIKRKLTSQAVKIRADIEVACYGYVGIDAVKAALKAGLACSTDAIPIKIKLLSSPVYVMTTAAIDKTDGLKALQTAIEHIERTIKDFGGVFKIQMEPKVVTANDEDDLVKKMEKAELENAEVPGDDDTEYEKAMLNGDVYADDDVEGHEEECLFEN